MNNPSVTFIIIAHNEKHAIKKCIESILNQKCSFTTSILIIDDGSTDNTAHQISTYFDTKKNISLIVNPKNLGRGASRKIGVDNANSTYIAFVDADIQIPHNWLSMCLNSILNFDAVGGIAIPDGDVQYIYTKYHLKPRKRNHTSEITGSNALFKSSIFKKINFEKSLPEGEDVDFTWRLKKHNFKVKCIDDLVSLHQEHKNYLESLNWLYRSGFGASRLFHNHKVLRLPDITFIGFLFIFSTSVILYTNFHNIYSLLIPLIFLILISTAHIFQKFYVKMNSILLFAVITNTTLITAYMIGRTYGLINIYIKHLK